MSPESERSLRISVCTTSYNCAQTLAQHIESIYNALGDIPFEYIVIDNRSTDGTPEELARAAAERRNMSLVSMRCSRGVGRQRAASLASAAAILMVDTDTVYYPTLRSLVTEFLANYEPRGIAIQAIYAGLYPRQLWFEVGGMRDLNYGEDLDLWMRIHAKGRIRWYPVDMGTNEKDPTHEGSQDVLSPRYDKVEKLFRLFRRELDIWRLRQYYQMDLESIRRANSVDLGLGEKRAKWFGPGPRATTWQTVRRLRSDIPRILWTPPARGSGRNR